MTDKNEVFEYLEQLRESGITNMFGSVSFVMNEFGMEERQSVKLVSEWMKTYRT